MNLDKILKFGKHKGKTIKEVLRVDPTYIEWAEKNIPHLLFEKKKSGEDKPKKELKNSEWLKPLKPNYNFLNEREHK